MTYNFDPQRWYDIEFRMLARRLEQGELNEKEYAEAVDNLDRRYDEMIDRLDGTYRCVP